MAGVTMAGEITAGHTTKVLLMESWQLMEAVSNQILEEFHMVTEVVEDQEQGCHLFMEIEDQVREFIILQEKV